jgi:hypothetical protein
MRNHPELMFVTIVSRAAIIVAAIKPMAMVVM